jgi:hypothetical protein
MWRLLFLSLSLSSFAYGACPLKDGDVVFIKSQTSQSALLKLTTGSEWSHVGMAFKGSQGWDIIEAVQPVRWTTLYSFIRRSRNLSFEVFRPNFAFNSDLVRKEAEKYLGKNYDLIFGWDNERWYCSELVWKAYKNTTGMELGSLEKVGDLNIAHPQVISEARKRFERYGMAFDLQTWKQFDVITPVRMMSSPLLEKVLTGKNINELKDCVL